MSKRLANRVAIVTGASQGIGREICHQFHLEGTSVVCVDIRPSAPNGFVPTHELIQQLGGKAIFVEADVSNAEKVEKLVATAVAEYGRVDILVNNAGIFPELTNPSKPMDEAVQDFFEETIRVNTRSTFLCTKYAVQQMKKQDPFDSGVRGWIVNISSMVAIAGVAGMPGYTASKGAITAMTRSTAIDVAKSGIVCNAIAPGFTHTAGLEAAFDGFLKGARPSDIAVSVPMQRLGKPFDIARVAVFLASDDASWVTGVELPVDGGTTAQ